MKRISIEADFDLRKNGMINFEPRVNTGAGSRLEYCF